MDRLDYDVSIVGYGPVGAFAALLLAERGLRVSIHERSTEPVTLPRAVGIDSESLRAFQRIGLGEEAHALVQPPRERDELWFTNSRREKIFGTEIPASPGHNGWRDICFFDQPELEAWLRERVAKVPEIQVFFGEEATRIEQPGEHALLHLRDASSGLERTVTSAYLLGCDGASSFVRSQAGIGWTSLGYDQDWLVVDVLAEPDSGLPLVTMQVCDPERLATYVCVKDPNRRWEFQLVDGETREEMQDPERIASLLDPWVPRDRYRLRRAAVYQFHAATADRWRDGRVLLAGDAAHQTPPFLGQGLNSGFRDAVNLGWKIPLVLQGLCDDRLLDSYFDERDAHARDLVDWAVGIGKLMETLAAREAGRPDPYPSASQSDGYGQGRTVPPLRSGVLVMDQAGPDRSIGFALRQPRVRRKADAPGEEIRFDELLGRSFALVGRTADDVALSDATRKLSERLGVAVAVLDELECVEGEHDSVFETSPAVLLRPDRFVFGHVDETHSLDDLFEDLAKKLQLL